SANTSSGMTTWYSIWCLPTGVSSALEQLANRPAVPILCHVERPSLDVEGGARRDAHRGQDRRVQIHDGDRIARDKQPTFRGGFAVEEGFLDAAAEHEDGAGAGEVAVEAVVDGLAHDVGGGAGLVAGGAARDAFDHHVAAELGGEDDERALEEAAGFEVE